MKINDNITLVHSLTSLKLNEIKTFRKLHVKEIHKESLQALDIEPVIGKREWIAKSILRYSNNDGEIWVVDWKYKQMFGD